MNEAHAEWASRESRGLPPRTELESFRRAMKMTQDELGLHLGLSKALVQYYESGRGVPSPKTWRKMLLNAKRTGLVLPPEILQEFIESNASVYRNAMEEIVV